MPSREWPTHTSVAPGESGTGRSRRRRSLRGSESEYTDTMSACSSGSAPRASCVMTEKVESKAASATIAERAVHMARGRPVSEKTRTLRAEVATATKR